jgi:hypothetical protein
MICTCQTFSSVEIISSSFSLSLFLEKENFVRGKNVIKCVRTGDMSSINQ